MKLARLLPSVVSITLLVTFISCDNDDINSVVGTSVLETPEMYEFTRNGSSTVSFSEQTSYLKMVNEIVAKFKDTTTAVTDFTKMFEAGEGFSDNALNGSGKNIKSKVGETTANQTEIQADFIAYYTKQVNEVFPHWSITATLGAAGITVDGKRYVNAKGLEYDQAFGKGLIGALVTEQTLNGSLEKVLTDSNELVEGKPYTDMEHHFDEAYGYVYGNIENDALMHKYIIKVEADSDFSGISDVIQNAFKLGRASIVTKKYEIRNQQIATIRKALSKVIAVRAVHYLQRGKSTIGTSDSFHDLSEGYGFIYALQFTHNPDTGKPYFTREKVKGYLDQLEANDGFWSLSTDTLDDISDAIATTFGFTVEQAAN